MQPHKLCAGICTVRWLKAHSLPIFYTTFVGRGRVKPEGSCDKIVNCERGPSEAAPPLVSLMPQGESTRR